MIQFDASSFNYLSNSYFSPMIINEKKWSTIEHYYQAMKFVDLDIQEKIRNTLCAFDAYTLGNTYKNIRDDWYIVRDDIMKYICEEKFKQNQELLKLLIETGNQKIIYTAPFDNYWGCGYEGIGKNMLGKILMDIRNKYK